LVSIFIQFLRRFAVKQVLLKQNSKEGGSLMEHYPKAYMEYLIHFHGERDYFECHEVLEEYWKEHPNGPFSRAYVGLIQIAVGLYHHRRGNVAGAVKMLQSALEGFSAEQVKQLGLDNVKLRNEITLRLEQLNAGNTVYSDIDLPFIDEALQEHCKQECLRRGGSWCLASDISNPNLIHKHTLRDRTEVIQERLRQKQLRQLRKGVSN
jgi:uncharacterized protein